MGIRLNSPPAPKEVPEDQTVSVVRLIIPHELNEAGDMKIDRGGIKLITNITTYNEDGEQMDEAVMVLKLADLPNPVKSTLKDLYSWLETEAQSRGFIGAGVAEPLDE